jgi:hypothetical protein
MLSLKESLNNPSAQRKLDPAPPHLMALDPSLTGPSALKSASLE